MRVLFWADYFLPIFGGVQVRALPFMQAMRRRGHEFLVVTSHESPHEIPERSDYDGIPVVRLPFLEALRRKDPREILELRRRVADLKRSFAPDLVHAFVSGPSVLFHLETAHVVPAPLVVSMTISLTHEAAGPNTLVGRALASASWVTANAQAVLDGLRALAPAIADKSSLVYSAQEVPALAPGPLRFDAPRLLCLGRVVADKGIDLAVRALAIVRRDFPTATLCIAGDGPEREPLTRLAEELGIADAVELVGWTPIEDVPNLIDSATVVLVPSRWEEAFASVAIQAAIMGRPVVATRVGGMAEAVLDSDTGLLVPRESPEALAAAVCDLLGDPDRCSAMGGRARARALREFSWHRYLDQFELVYSRCV